MSTTTHVYGEFVGAHHLEAAILAVLWKWLPSYQYEVSREAGLEPNYLLPIRSWRVASSMERFPEDQLPSVILVNNGVPLPPIKHSTADAAQAYLAHWQIQLGVHVAAKGQKVKAIPRALTLARMHQLAIRLCMIQKRDEDGVLGMIDPVGEAPNQALAVEDDRTTCLAVTSFRVETDDWAEWGAGPIEPIYPAEPEVDPPTERPVWPIVENVDVDILKIPPDATVQPVEGN
jgi:hypothetical protein